MKRVLLVAILVVLVLAAFVARATFYIVDETNQAIITQFGEFRRTVSEPGLHVKIPFIQSVTYFEKRVLVSDGDVGEYITLDKKRVLVDHVSRWQIADPHQFFKTVQSEAGALARLDDIIFGLLRGEIARHDFVDLVREQRESIMSSVTHESVEQAARLGLEVLDIRIKRIDLPQEVQASVFARMEAERQRIAMRYRSEGEQRAMEITSAADREREVILATAYEQSQSIMGEGDAMAIGIYAEAFSQNPDFYGFMRRLDAYREMVGSDTTMVLDSGSSLFRYLQRPFDD